MTFVTNVLPTMPRSHTSCIWVIIKRNDWQNTLCSSGNTNSSTIKMNHTLCQLPHGHQGRSHSDSAQCHTIS